MRINKQTFNYKPVLKTFKPLLAFAEPELDIDTSNIFEREELDALIKKFAPILCFHAEEAHQPVDVDWYLKQSQIINPANNTKFPVSKAHLNASEHEVENYYFELKDNKQNKAQPKVYVHAKSYQYEYTDLQYWFLFSGKSSNSTNIKWLVEGITGHHGAINLNPIGCQSGHWERITIRINNKSRLAEKVFLPNANGGAWFAIEKMQANNKQIIAFVSKNNHSFYESAGIKPIETLKFELVSSILEFSLYDECTIESIFDFSKSCELISTSFTEQAPISEPDWLGFMGKWGNPALQNLDTFSVNTILKEAFGTDLIFLLGNNILNKLSAFLIAYHTTVCECKALGPKNKPCWSGKAAD